MRHIIYKFSVISFFIVTCVSIVLVIGAMSVVSLLLYRQLLQLFW